MWLHRGIGFQDPISQSNVFLPKVLLRVDVGLKLSGSISNVCFKTMPRQVESVFVRFGIRHIQLTSDEKISTALVKNFQSSYNLNYASGSESSFRG